ncbi:hypothetical protein BDV93DRAFT_562942 [Ceratobasidium sp. AG-I]|nr:hypothetical protein BDV93DRAFT_562942 [Ceratobasidium sp. AG-I]
MRLPTPVGDQTTPMLPFALASITFATAASSLSKAAQAMAEVALAMSQVSEAFSTMNLSTTSTVLYNKPASDLSDKGGSDSMESPNGSSGYCGSEFEREEGDIYDDDDMMAGTLTANSSPPPDPITTLPCCSGTMDLTQLRLTPHVPVHGVPDTPDMDKLKPSPISTDVGRAFKDATSVVSTPIPVKKDLSSKPVVPMYASRERIATTSLTPDSRSKPLAPVESAVQPKMVRPNAPALGQIASRKATITRVTARVVNVSGGQCDPQTELSQLRVAVEKHPRLPWGRSFIELGDEFEAIPLISCIALGSNKTICLVPIPDSLEHYSKIFNAITKLKVLRPQEPHTPEMVEHALKRFESSTAPTLLLLPFNSLSHILLSTAKPDCVVHWDLKQITLLDLRIRCCLLVPPGEHYKPASDIQASSYGVVKYPESVKDSFLGPKSPLHLVRNVATQVLTSIPDSTVEILHNSWLGYYGTGPFKRSSWSRDDLLKHARSYATKVFLRGPEYNGAKSYPPDNEEIIPSKPLANSCVGTESSEVPVLNTEKKKLIQPRVPPESAPSPSCDSSSGNASFTDTSSGNLNCGSNISPDQPGFTASSSVMGATRATTSNASESAHSPEPALTSVEVKIVTPGRYFIVLEEEFDAIPLISFLAEHCKRTVCFSSNPESLTSYQKLFSAFENIKTFHLKSSVVPQEAIRLLPSVTSPALFLRSSLSVPTTPLDSLKADCLVHWGATQDFTTYIQSGASQVRHSLMLLTPEEYSDTSVQRQLASQDIKVHPLSSAINDYGERSILDHMRKKTADILKAPNSSAIIQELYYASLSFYSLGRGRSDEVASETIARRANYFAARVLLRGDAADGSKRFKPTGDRPHITSRAVVAFKLQDAREMGLLSELMNKESVLVKTKLPSPSVPGIGRHSGDLATSERLHFM